MQEIEHKKNKVYYTMGEVAEMFDVNPSLLRYWEQEFDILKPHRNKKGNRLFTPRDVDNIRVIYYLLKERKMKIEVARKYIRDYRKEVDRDTEIAEHSMHTRCMLRETTQHHTPGGLHIHIARCIIHWVIVGAAPGGNDACKGTLTGHAVVRHCGSPLL